MTMQANESTALAALAAQEATSRQERQPEDRRLTRAKTHLDSGLCSYCGETDSLADEVLGDLIAFAEERLLVNRGLIAQQKPQEDKGTELPFVTDEQLIAECAKRRLITLVSQ